MSWTRYFINKGDTDWKPLDGFKFINRFSDLDWKVKPNESLIFDYKYPSMDGYLVDKDWKDWKKVGGVSLASWCCLDNLWDKNNDAIMLAWRWNPELGFLEFSVYENKGGKNIKYETPALLLRLTPEEFNQEVCMKIRKISSTRYEAYLYKGSQTWQDVNPIVIIPRRKFNMYSLIGMWYGGANNAPGPWGGAAPKDMYMDVFFD